MDKKGGESKWRGGGDDKSEREGATDDEENESNCRIIGKEPWAVGRGPLAWQNRSMNLRGRIER